MQKNKLIFPKKRADTSTAPDLRIAVAGNPNVGKSTLFNALTGMHQHTGNWSGKTVGAAEGYCRIGNVSCQLIDVPGTYSLSTMSPEEAIAREIMESDKADAILVVCDATCLERNLVLALQIIDLGKPVIICVNLLDEAERKGIKIDLDLLKERLNTPVVGAIARKRGGLKELTKELEYLAVSQSLCPPCRAKEEKSAELYVKEAEDICRKVCSEGSDRSLNVSLFDRILTGKKTAYPIMGSLLLFVLWLTVYGANYPSKLLSSLLFGLGDVIGEALLNIGCHPFIYGLLIDGAYKTLAWIVAVMLPPMAIFFPLFTLLEDSGFLPRIAFNLDRPFRLCKSCGKQALTMCMSFGCNAAGVVGCRIIDSPREQKIAILTSSLVPCNGRFPILIALITMFFVGSESLGAAFASAALLTSLIILCILATFTASRFLSATFLRGVPSAFTLELPPYRPPQIGKVIVRSVFDRTLFVLGRAVATAIPAGIIIWLMANLSVGEQTALSAVSQFLDPFAKFFGLDGVIFLAFILSMPANEIFLPICIMAYTSAGALVEYSNLSELQALLSLNGWTVKTAICVTLFTLFHWPCATTLLTVKKECGGARWAVAAALIPTIIGFLICAAVNLIFYLI